MFNLSKKTEYGLMALAHLSELGPDRLATVGEIAEVSGLPKELLAKILSELVKAGLALSCSGPFGGFRLARSASAVSLADVVAALEKKPILMPCAGGDDHCHRSSGCAIRSPMARVQKRINRILEETLLTDFMARQIG